MSCEVVTVTLVVVTNPASGFTKISLSTKFQFISTVFQTTPITTNNHL